MDFKHEPIMIKEVIEGLQIDKDGLYLDGTLGGAGHSIEIVKRLDKGKLIGIDQDTDALEASAKRLEAYKDNVILVHNNYENVDQVLEELNIDGLDGILLDIGVSSYQLDQGDRGFSYHQDARLDMRMDTSREFSAWNVVNEYSVEDLEYIIWNYGEDSWARRIAKFIVDERKEKPIDTTLELVEVIKKAIPKKVRMEGGHPARQTFQAIRIEVNNELEVLKNSIEKMVEALNKGGRLAIITFHSLEDKIVKDKFRDLNKACTCPPDFPICICDKKRQVKIITRRPLVASEAELEENTRSRSAKLRIVEKI